MSTDAFKAGKVKNKDNSNLKPSFLVQVGDVVNVHKNGLDILGNGGQVLAGEVFGVFEFVEVIDGDGWSIWEVLNGDGEEVELLFPLKESLYFVGCDLFCH